MHSNFSHHNSTLQWTALALLVICFAHPQIRAQAPDRKAGAARPESEEITFVFHTISWGMVRGQSARVSVVNPNKPSEQDRLRTISVQALLFDSSGAVIAKSDEIAVPPGAFRSIDFNRDDLPVTNDPGGRIQTRAEVRYKFFSIVDRTQLNNSPSIEIVDNSTGKTAAIWLTIGFFEVTPSGKPQ